MQTQTMLSGRTLGKLALAVLFGLGVYQHLQEQAATSSSAPLFVPAPPQTPASSAPRWGEPGGTQAPRTANPALGANCASLAPAYRTACEARQQGQGSASSAWGGAAPDPTSGSGTVQADAGNAPYPAGSPLSSSGYGNEDGSSEDDMDSGYGAVNGGDGSSGYESMNGGYGVDSGYGSSGYSSSGYGGVDSGYGSSGYSYDPQSGISAPAQNPPSQGNNMFTNDDLWQRDLDRQAMRRDVLGGTTTYQDASGNHVQTEGYSGSAYQNSSGEVQTFDSPYAAPEAGSGYTQLTPLGTDAGSSSATDATGGL